MSALLAPIPISALRPSDEEITAARKDAREEFAESLVFGDLCEALENDLNDKMAEILLERVKRVREHMVSGKSINIVDALVISAFVGHAFSAHVNRWSEPNVAAYIEDYGISQAEELRERGLFVDALA